MGAAPYQAGEAMQEFLTYVLPNTGEYMTAQEKLDEYFSPKSIIKSSSFIKQCSSRAKQVTSLL